MTEGFGWKWAGCHHFFLHWKTNCKYKAFLPGWPYLCLSSSSWILPAICKRFSLSSSRSSQGWDPGVQRLFKSFLSRGGQPLQTYALVTNLVTAVGSVRQCHQRHQLQPQEKLGFTWKATWAKGHHLKAGTDVIFSNFCQYGPQPKVQLDQYCPFCRHHLTFINTACAELLPKQTAAIPPQLKVSCRPHVVPLALRCHYCSL